MVHWGPPAARTNTSIFVLLVVRFPRLSPLLSITFYPLLVLSESRFQLLDVGVAHLSIYRYYIENLLKLFIEITIYML